MGYKFCFTKDGSVGLFDEDVNDIYHSSCGAYQEAIDKFIIPAQIERYNNNSCNILDICYGIGYNTKALLKFTYKNNLNIKYNIDALETNKELVEISPFIKNIKNNYLDFEIDKFILSEYLKNNNLNFENLKSIIVNNKKFLTQFKPDFDNIIKKYGYKYNMLDKFNTFLHNIYYHNMAIRPKKDKKTPFFNEKALMWHLGDARRTILSLKNKYDIVFLDAFTATKQPTLWTYDFLKQVTNVLNKENGIVVSYSSASPYRKALLDLGFYVGKYYDSNSNIISTVASFNKNLIKYSLDDFESGLLQTKAGITYKDLSLSSTTDEILARRKSDIENSSLESTSKYYKRNNRRYGKY